MGTTFDVIHLGTATDLDPFEGNTNAENAGALVGLTFGSSGDPLSGNIQSWSPGSTGYAGGMNNWGYDTDNLTSPDTFRIDGGPDQSLDAVVVFDATITYSDGTTDTLAVNIAQDTAGNLYIVPHLFFNADQDVLEAKPITSLTIDGVSDSDNVLTGDRYEPTYLTVVDGTGGDDTMGIGFTDADGDQIDGSDGDDDYVDAGAGNDTIDAGAGDDTVLAGDGADVIQGGAGADRIDAGAGDDVIQGGTGADSIDAGAGDDTIHGDTTDTETLDPLLLLNFEDGASGTATDDSGNNYDGVYQSGAAAGDIGWDGSGTGVVLDGHHDYVEIADDPAFDLDEGTIAIRFNTDSLTYDQTLFSRDSSGYDGGGHITLQVNTDGSIDVRLQDTGLSHYATSASGLVTPGTWHSVAVSFGADGMHLYLDGTEVATDSHTGGISGNDEPWTLGASQGHSGDGVADLLVDHFDGTLDEFIIYGSQLEADQIAALDTGGAGAVTSNSADVLLGGDGDDTFVVTDGFGDDTITGGEGGETDGDTVDLSAVTAPITVVYSGDEAGTITDSTDTISFSEVESLVLGDASDSVDASLDTTGVDVDGGGGADTIIGGTGGDTLTGGGGSDSLTGGAGDDTYVVSDGDGSDVITDFDMGDTNADGFTNDQLDVSGLTDGSGNPVDAWDVVVTDTNGDGTGDAILTFPNGESITLKGVSTTQVDSAPKLLSMGIICYVTGTMITTDKGDVPVDDLKVGDMLLTATGGYEPIIWRDHTVISKEEQEVAPNLRPVRIKPGAFNNDKALFVSQQHCMVVDIDGQSRFVRAKHLAECTSHAHVIQAKKDVTYHHILLPEHAVIYADGAASESFYPGPQSVKMLSAPSLASLRHAIAPSTGQTLSEAYGPRQLPCLTLKEVKLHEGALDLLQLGTTSLIAPTEPVDAKPAQYAAE